MGDVVFDRFTSGESDSGLPLFTAIVTMPFQPDSISFGTHHAVLSRPVKPIKEPPLVICDSSDPVKGLSGKRIDLGLSPYTGRSPKLWKVGWDASRRC